MDFKLRKADAIKFAHIVSKRGLDDAVESYGEAVTAGEYRALKALDSDELTSLLKINAKINDVRGGGLAADDWTCVNIIC